MPFLAAQQLDGADPASCGKTDSRYYLSAGRAAHLEAVRRRGVRAFHIRRLLSRPRVCIFCGQPPTGNTREHIIPRWLIEHTGDPRRKILLWPFTSQSVISGRPNPFKAFSFDSFAFPSCSSCNSTFASLEDRAKPLILALLEGRPLSALDFDVVLDWFDKVRVGLWLAFHYFLDRNYWGVLPHFFIANRIAQADRALFISRSNDHQPGIRFAGVNTPAFAHTPSCFGLAINDLFIINISHQSILSEGAGFPFVTKYLFRPDERIESELHDGKEALAHPLLRLNTPYEGILVGQPIVPRMEDPSAAGDAYMSEYVSRHLISEARGKVLIDRDSHLSVYPNSPSTSWAPSASGDFLGAISRNATETLGLQNDLVRLVTLSPDLSDEQRQFMEYQNANCIKANEDLLAAFPYPKSPHAA